MNSNEGAVRQQMRFPVKRLALFTLPTAGMQSRATERGRSVLRRAREVLGLSKLSPLERRTLANKHR